jgi:hypothetical protein
MNGPGFFVGVGAMRSGTTWLSLYLRNHSEVAFSPIKECHFFTSIYDPTSPGHLRQPFLTRLAIKGLARYAAFHPVAGVQLAWHYAGMRKLRETSYRRYMEVLGGNKLISGEISPSYVRLTDDGFRAIERTLDRPRYIYLVRNPVDRLLSELSFRKNRLGSKTPSLVTPDDVGGLSSADKSFTSVDYPNTINKIERLADPDRLLTLFTEDLFDPAKSQQTCDRVCDFLRISRKAASIDDMVNTAPKLNVAPELRSALANRLAFNYAFFQARFGDAMPANWQADAATLKPEMALAQPASAASGRAR